MVARLIDPSNQHEASASQRLRFSYFCLARAWVAENSELPGHDVDTYDDFAHHLAVFSGSNMVGYLRALLWRPGVGYMMEHEFGCLLTDKQFNDLHRQDSIEISRLTLAPNISMAASLNVTEFLFKLLYQFCLANDIHQLYAVIEAGWLRRFRNCFNLPFQALGPSIKFPDGTRTVAAHASLRELEGHLSTVNPDKLRWYRDLDNRAIP